MMITKEEIVASETVLATHIAITKSFCSICSDWTSAAKIIDRIPFPCPAVVAASALLREATQADSVLDTLDRVAREHGWEWGKRWETPYDALMCGAPNPGEWYADRNDVNLMAETPARLLELILALSVKDEMIDGK